MCGHSYMYGMRGMHTCSHRSNYERHRLKLGSFIPCFSPDNTALEGDNDNYSICVTYIYIYKFTLQVSEVHNNSVKQ